MILGWWSLWDTYYKLPKKKMILVYKALWNPWVNKKTKVINNKDKSTFPLKLSQNFPKNKPKTFPTFDYLFSHPLFTHPRILNLANPPKTLLYLCKIGIVIICPVQSSITCISEGLQFDELITKRIIVLIVARNGPIISKVRKAIDLKCTHLRCVLQSLLKNRWNA